MPQRQPHPEDPALAEALEALAVIPSARFLLVSQSGDRMRGCVVRWVQKCGSSPPMVMIALPKGDAISPVIRDRRMFGLGLIAEDDGLLPRRFGEGTSEADPFLGLPLATTTLDLPIPERCGVRIECEMVRHLDIDSDCELYVGVVKQGSVVSARTPASRRRGASRTAREEPKAPRVDRQAPASPRARTRRS